MKNVFFLILLSLTFSYCNNNNSNGKKVVAVDVTIDTAQKSPATIMVTNIEMLKNIIVYDVFSPPVASRIYAYASLAQYEAIRFNDTTLFLLQQN